MKIYHDTFSLKKNFLAWPLKTQETMADSSSIPLSVYIIVSKYYFTLKGTSFQIWGRKHMSETFCHKRNKKAIHVYCAHIKRL